MAIKVEKVLSLGEEEESKSEEDEVTDICDVQVELLKIVKKEQSDHEKVCILFKRVSGNTWLLYELFEELREDLKHLDNAIHKFEFGITE